MDLGFETIGNACLLCHDRGPVLVTDPWLSGPAYFGSWALSHAVPEEQQAHARACRYVWLSHGHPDHLSLPSLEQLRHQTILLPDHRGGRIARDLTGMGFAVRVLRDGAWTELSPRLRIASIANYNQDAVLLIDLDGHLLVDANDAGDRGAAAFLARERRRFHKHTFLACLTGYGDADMIHFFGEDGRPVLPAAAAKAPVGPQIARLLRSLDLRFFLPSSAMHVYQRTDSAWANAYKTPVDAHQQGFVAEDGRDCLPPFVRYDLARDQWSRIAPPPAGEQLQPPEAFGDDWHTPLDDDDLERLRAYWQRFEHLRSWLGFVQFRVGGVDRTIDIAPGHRRGITFATPRQSLLQAVAWEAFDDLLIGNFTKTVLHGDWGGRQGAAALYPDFTPFVTKYGDNGRAFTAAELRAYARDYRDRGFCGPGSEPLEQEMWAALARHA